MLILGGTAEASGLAAALAAEPRVAPLLSLAGVTSHPAPSPIPRRVGGFGGADGLASFLRAEAIAMVVDATHPFAARMTANARVACAAAGVPLLRVRRPPWDERGTLPVDSVAAAAAALGPAPRRVLLTVGRLDLAPFAAAAQHRYWVRSIDAPDPALLPRGAVPIVARGPFTLAGEAALLRRLGIEVLVTKNSGAAAVAAKLDAARAGGVMIVMVRRPPEPGTVFDDAPEALAAIRRHFGLVGTAA